MSKSSLVDMTILSPNHSGKRRYPITRITPHCVVGQLSAESIAGCFPAGRQASCNYGIGTKGDVSLIVDEVNRSWCSSSSDNDNRAITIECASDMKEPYVMNMTVYNKLIDLCVDICKRYGKTKLIWIADKNKSLLYVPKGNEMIITVHRWFANKSCPGDWLYSRLGDVANKVTTRLNVNVDVTKEEEEMAEVTKGNFRVMGKDFKMDRILQDGHNYIDVRDIAEALDLEVSYESKTKTVFLTEK